MKNGAGFIGVQELAAAWKASDKTVLAYLNEARIDPVFTQCIGRGDMRFYDRETALGRTPQFMEWRGGRLSARARNAYQSRVANGNAPEKKAKPNIEARVTALEDKLAKIGDTLEALVENVNAIRDLWK